MGLLLYYHGEQLVGLYDYSMAYKPEISKLSSIFWWINTVQMNFLVIWPIPGPSWRLASAASGSYRETTRLRETAVIEKPVRKKRYSPGRDWTGDFRIP